MNKQKKSGGWILLILGVIFFLFGAVFTISESEMIFGKKVSNINKLLEQGTLEENLDSYIEIDVDAVLDNFAEKTHKTYGITTGKDQYYLIWLDDDSMIALTTNGKKNVAEMDRVYDETWNYLNEKTDELTDKPVHLKGKLVNMGTDVKKFYQESLDYLEISSADRDIYYYIIDCNDSQLLLILVAVVIFGLSLLMLVLFASTRRALRNAALYDGPMQAAPLPPEAAKYSGSEPLFGPGNEGARMSEPADRLAELYEDPKIK